MDSCFRIKDPVGQHNNIGLEKVLSAVHILHLKSKPQSALVSQDGASHHVVLEIFCRSAKQKHSVMTGARKGIKLTCTAKLGPGI